LLQQAAQHKQRQRRRMLAIAVLAILATSTAIGFAIKPWLTGEQAFAGEKAPDPAKSDRDEGPSDKQK